jgi:hypothetical protein
MSGEEMLDIVVASPELAMRHAYALITANAMAITPHMASLLCQLAAPTVAKPFNVGDLLCMVEDQARRISAEEAAH